jgi:hypothetical protein
MQFVVGDEWTPRYDIAAIWKSISPWKGAKNVQLINDSGQERYMYIATFAHLSNNVSSNDQGSCNERCCQVQVATA